MSRRLLCALSLLLPLAGTQHAHASVPDTIRGRVHDAAGNPVAGAEIIVEDLGRLAVSRSNGDFAIATMLPATLVVRRAGYASVTRVLGAPARFIDIALEPTPFPIDPINVTATRQPSARTVSLPATALTREELRRAAGVSLAHELDRVAGVRAVTTGEQVGKPVIRGLFGSRVLVLEDAMRLEDYSWSDEDAPSIDARSADRVEVVRGPASILFGSDALGGVVNVIPAPVPQPGTPFRRSGVELSGSSNRREAGITGRMEGASHSLGWRALVIGHFADDFRTPLGPVQNTGYGALNGELAAGTQKPWGTLTMRYARYAGEFKLLEMDAPAGQPAAAGEGGPERKLADDRLQLTGIFPVGAVRLETRAQLQRHWLEEIGDLPGTAGSPKLEAPVFEMLLNTMTADVLAHHSLRTNMQGSVGLSVMAQTNDSRGPLFIVPDATIRNAAVSAVEHVVTGPLEWTAGARADHHSVDARDVPAGQIPAGTTTATRNAASFNFGTVARVAGALSLRGNIGRAWRAPNLFELYANGPRIGEARFEMGDPNLAPERATELDVGADVSTRILRGQLSYYRSNIAGFIALQPTEQTRAGLRVFQHRQVPAQLQGWEAEAELRPVAALRVFAAYDEVRGQERENGAALPWIPAPRLQSHLEIGGTAAGLQHAYARVGAEHVWKKARVAANEPVIDGYTLVNLALGGAAQWVGRPLRIDVGVKNALNTKYKDFLNRYRDFALNPGTDITLRVSVDF